MHSYSNAYINRLGLAGLLQGPLLHLPILAARSTRPLETSSAVMARKEAPGMSWSTPADIDMAAASEELSANPLNAPSGYQPPFVRAKKQKII